MRIVHLSSDDLGCVVQVSALISQNKMPYIALSIANLVDLEFEVEILPA